MKEIRLTINVPQNVTNITLNLNLNSFGETTGDQVGETKSPPISVVDEKPLVPKEIKKRSSTNGPSSSVKVESNNLMDTAF